MYLSSSSSHLHQVIGMFGKGINFIGDAINRELLQPVGGNDDILVDGIM